MVCRINFVRVAGVSHEVLETTWWCVSQGFDFANSHGARFSTKTCKYDPAKTPQRVVSTTFYLNCGRAPARIELLKLVIGIYPLS